MLNDKTLKISYAAENRNLYLRINKQRPSVRIGKDDRILCAHAIRRQTFVMPASDGDVISQQTDRIYVRSDSNLGLWGGVRSTYLHSHCITYVLGFFDPYYTLQYYRITVASRSNDVLTMVELYALY